MDAIIFKMNLSDKYSDSISLFNELQRFLFEEEKSEGYSDLVLETKSYISGSVINKIPTFLYVFDTDKQLIEKREEIIVKKVDFSIDINNMLFEIFTSSVKDAKRVYLTINHTLKDEIKLHPYDKTISETLISINNNIENVDFTKLHIKNFKLENLAQGYFEIKNIQNEYAWSLIEEYKRDITKVSLNIVYEDFNHSLSISESGKVKITSKNKGKTKTFFDVLKEKVFKLK